MRCVVVFKVVHSSFGIALFTPQPCFMFLPIPLIKNSEFKDVYVFELFIDAFPAMAGGMFVAGLIAYVRELHAYEAEQQVSKITTPDTDQI